MPYALLEFQLKKKCLKEKQKFLDEFDESRALSNNWLGLSVSIRVQLQHKT